MRLEGRVGKLRLILLGGILLATAASASFRAGQVCTADSFAVRDGFVAARRGTCTVLAANHVRVDIRPERSKDRKKINNSPWYAFKLIPVTAGDAVITLRYTDGSHRYWPKISVDGLTWYPMDERNVSVAPARGVGCLRVLCIYRDSFRRHRPREGISSTFPGDRHPVA